jgi:c(7)-type cytochrome triheme protein
MHMHEDSPGQVVFDHETHVDADAPGCATCHQDAFSIIAGASGELRGPLNVSFHDTQHCGKCHNGDDAFHVEEDCADCHWED